MMEVDGRSSDSTMMEGILRIKYSYVGGHKLGDVPNLMVKGELSFGDSTQDVCIDKGLRDDVADSFFRTYTHPNYLPLKLYLPDVLVHTPYQHKITDYVLNLKKSNIFPVASFTPCGSTYPCLYLAEEYRIMISNLRDFIVDVHKNGRSLVNLDSGHLCMHDGMLKVWGVRFYIYGEDVAVREKAILKDWRMFRKVVKGLFQLRGRSDVVKKLVEFAHFDECVSNCRDDSKVANHWALLSSAERLHYIKAIFDTRNIVFTAPETTGYVGDLSTLMNDAWGWMYCTREGQNYLPWLQKFEEKASDAMRKCYNPSEYEENNYDLLRLCRYMATHLWEHMAPYLSKHITQKKGKPPGDRDVDLSISKAFGVYLVHLHSATPPSFVKFLY